MEESFFGTIKIYRISLNFINEYNSFNIYLICFQTSACKFYFDIFP